MVACWWNLVGGVFFVAGMAFLAIAALALLTLASDTDEPV